MNRETRRLCKIPQEVRQEVVPFYLNRGSIATEQTDCGKIDKLDDDTSERIRSGLAVSSLTSPLLPSSNPYIYKYPLTSTLMGIMHAI